MQSYKDKIKKQKNSNDSENLKLSQQNLVPVYLIEDNMKNNFTLIERAVNDHNRQFKRINEKIVQANLHIQNLDEKIIIKIKQSENQTQNGLKRDLEGIVTMIINRHLKVVLQKFEEKQNQENQKQSALEGKLKAIQQKLSYEIAQQNQKYFLKQITKVQKQIDKKIQSTMIKNNLPKPNKNKIKDQTQEVNNRNNQQENKNSQNIDLSHFQGTLEQMKQKLQQVQNFSGILDKKFSDEFQSLRQNWKEVGGQLIDNKKILNKKIDNLNFDLIKLKTVSEFAHMPENMEESFKKQIIQKFTEVYRVISSMASRSEFESINDRNRKILNRYNDQLIQLRKQQVKNNQFFTVYMNNSKSQDIVDEIHKLRKDILNDKHYLDAIFDGLRKKDQSNFRMIQQLGKNLGAIEIDRENIEKKVFNMNLHTQNLIEKVKVLEDLNHISPEKMKKIHTTLDKGFNHNPFESKQGSPEKFRNRQVYAQITKLKDQIFLMSSESNIHGIQKQDVIGELKNQIKKIHQKIERIKNQSEQGALSRKPWVCLSCDKQKMSKKINDTFQKNASKKKVSLDIGKSGGFLTNRSEKNLTFKLSNVPQIQQKFQIYQKFRQKYLTDTLRLPELYKQKIGSLQNQLM